MSIPTESIGCASPGSVLWNLLANSLKFTDESGRVHVLLERVTPHLEISVADTGQEITPEFYHSYSIGLDRQTPRAPDLIADWLGLAIVKTLIELHGDNAGRKRRRLPRC